MQPQVFDRDRDGFISASELRTSMTHWPQQASAVSECTCVHFHLHVYWRVHVFVSLITVVWQSSRLVELECSSARGPVSRNLGEKLNDTEDSG